MSISFFKGALVVFDVGSWRVWFLGYAKKQVERADPGVNTGSEWVFYGLRVARFTPWKPLRSKKVKPAPPGLPQSPYR